MTAPQRHDDSLPDLLASLQTEIASEDRGWRRLRSWSTPTRHVAALFVVLIVTLAVLVATPRLDLAAYPRVRLIVSAAALIAITSFGLRRFFWPCGERVRREWAVVAAAAALLVIPVVLALLPAPHELMHLHPESFEGTGADFVPRALACLVFGFVVGIPTTLVALVMNRQPRLTRPRIALAAGVGGLAGTLGLLLHCPLVSVAHRLAGHGAVGVVAAAALAAVLLLIRRGQKTRKRA